MKINDVISGSVELGVEMAAIKRDWKHRKRKIQYEMNKNMKTVTDIRERKN